MTIILDDRSVDSVFRTARRCRTWLDKSVSDTIIEALWELARVPPTVRGNHPAQIVFVKSPEAKERLAAALGAEEAAAALAAPAVAVIGCDCTPGDDASRDALLQAGYLILAARALGLDCTPAAPREIAHIDRTLFSDGRATALLICYLGYGDARDADAAAAGPGFEVACRII
ncbi:MAG TPA: hypothetical protein VET85_10320 [Stellaceae bacterium]|nr:hypothetical protein [Stellaceae bacterium]